MMPIHFIKFKLLLPIVLISQFIPAASVIASSPAEMYEQTIKAFLTEPNLDQAIKNLEAIAKQYPDFYPAYFDLGLLHEKSKQYQQSVHNFQKYLQYDKNSQRSKRASKKIQELTAVLSYNQEQLRDFEYLSRIKVANGWMQNNLLSQAVSELDMAIRMEPRRYEAYAQYASLLTMIKAYSEAQKFVKLAYQLAPISKKPELETAQKLIEEFLEAERIDKAAEADIENGEYTQAIEKLNRSLTLVPDHQRNQLKLANLYILMLQTTKAEFLLNQLIKSPSAQIADLAKEMLADLKTVLQGLDSKDDLNQSESSVLEAFSRYLKYLMDSQIKGMNMSVTSEQAVCISFIGGKPICTNVPESLNQKLDEHPDARHVFLTGHDGWVLLSGNGNVTMEGVDEELKQTLFALIEQNKPIQDIQIIEKGFIIFHSNGRMISKNIPQSLSAELNQLIENGNTLQSVSFMQGKWLILYRDKNGQKTRHLGLSSDLVQALGQSGTAIDKVTLFPGDNWVIHRNGSYTYSLNP